MILENKTHHKVLLKNNQLGYLQHTKPYSLIGKQITVLALDCKSEVYQKFGILEAILDSGEQYKLSLK